jgi:hypothetical protein
LQSYPHYQGIKPSFFQYMQIIILCRKHKIIIIELICEKESGGKKEGVRMNPPVIDRVDMDQAECFFGALSIRPMTAATKQLQAAMIKGIHQAPTSPPLAASLK